MLRRLAERRLEARTTPIPQNLDPFKKENMEADRTDNFITVISDCPVCVLLTQFKTDGLSVHEDLVKS